MSDEFDSLDAIQKAVLEVALNSCRTLGREIENRLCNKRSENFVHELSLADLYASLERAAGALEQKSGRWVDNTPTPTTAIRKALRLRYPKRSRAGSARLIII